MARSARLVLRVVYVAAVGAAEARRRVADVLLRAATGRGASTNADASTPPSLEAPPASAEKAA